MRDDHRFYVTEAPRRPNGRLFNASTVAECLTWARSRPDAGRLAIWAAVPPPDHDVDVALCVPIGLLGDVEASAAEVVDRWERSWLLIESAPRAHREEARAALHELVVLALAAAKGLDDQIDLAF